MTLRGPLRWEARRLALEVELGELISVDGLTSTWSIFQRQKGHRHSTDDLLTGWYALEVRGAWTPRGTPPRCALDLGAGIGTVGLLVLWGMPEGRLTCIERQDISYRFLCENIRANGLGDRVDARHGDLRELNAGTRFPLVTGSPPYFDIKRGIVPADPQKAHARFELAGDIGDYARAATRHLEDDGWFVFCFPFAQKARALAAVRGEGFSVVRSRDVVPRAGLAPLFSLFACQLGERGEETEPPFVVRDAAGAHTDSMQGVRARFGWPARSI